MSKKYVKLGQIVKKYGEEGEDIKLNLDDLKELVGLLREYGKNVLGDMSVDDIRAAKKLPKGDANKMFDPFIARFDKTDEDYAKGCPEFILADLCLKISDFE